MAGKRRTKITAPDIQGLKYFDQLAPLLARLHDDGCARDKAGNRELHFDQYCMLILLYLFKPVVTPCAACNRPANRPRFRRSWDARGRRSVRFRRRPRSSTPNG